MNVCSHCRMEVPTAANKCPYCGENPYDGFDGWTQIISWTILGTIGYVIFSAIFG